MSFSAVVVDIVEERRVAGRQLWQILLDRTEFRRGDSGTIEAVSRSGARLTIPVLGVVVNDGEVWHQVEKPMAAGTPVTGHVIASSSVAP